MEDIVALLDGRPEIVDEIAASNAILRRYLAKQATEMLQDESFRQAVPGHLETLAGSAGRVERLFERLRAITAMAE